MRGGASFPRERVADHSLAQKLLGWEPKVCFRDGLRQTVDSFFAHKNRDQFKSSLPKVLTERAVSLVVK